MWVLIFAWLVAAGGRLRVWCVHVVQSVSQCDSDDNAIGKASKSGFSPFQNKIIDNRTDTATRS